MRFFRIDATSYFVFDVIHLKHNIMLGRSMEHRCGHRRLIEVKVSIRTRGGVVGQGRLCEASASGARLVASLPLAVHSVIRVIFNAGDSIGASRRVVLEAEVVRKTENGFGLEWTRFAPEALRVLYSQRVRATLQDEEGRGGCIAGRGR